MATDLIHDRGRGPEIAGTRVTVFNLLPHLLDPSLTEATIGRINGLTPEQVAVARAYVLTHPEVLAEHLRIEAKLGAANPPEVIEQAKQAHSALLRFRDWLAQRRQEESQEPTVEVTSGSGRMGSGRFPTFREWLAEREFGPGEAS